MFPVTRGCVIYSNGNNSKGSAMAMNLTTTLTSTNGEILYTSTSVSIEDLSLLLRANRSVLFG